MSFKKFKQSALQKVGLIILSPAVNVLCKTLKIEYKNYSVIEQLRLNDQNFIAAFWHGSMLLPWYIFRNKNFSALVSQSKDGELLTRLLKKWNYSVVRGSSNVGGKEAMQLMIDEVSAGKNLAITPDGPKGPEFKMKPGTIVLSKKTGATIILIGVGYKNYWELGSWDKFKVPKFFSRVVLKFSEPITINPDLSYDEVSQAIIDSEQKLNSLQTEAIKSC
jgi:lysophospholipid acyltransferase (LPLAT)-like uncharacterized protein